VHSVSGSTNALDVAGGLPHLRGRMTEESRPTTSSRPAPSPPPLPLDVLLELDAERAVVPRGAGAAVDLAAGVDEPAALAELTTRTWLSPIVAARVVSSSSKRSPAPFVTTPISMVSGDIPSLRTFGVALLARPWRSCEIGLKWR
jgi:hypothetical protein